MCMAENEIPLSAKNIKVLSLEESARKAAMLARFGSPIEQPDLNYLLGNGLKAAAHSALSCMGWVWRQWLTGVSRAAVSKQVEPLVERGLELRGRSKSYHCLPEHDLHLLHCAIFSGSDTLVRSVAEQIADAEGDKGAKPMDFGHGELYAAAWSGMMKYWILGDQPKALQQADIIWGAYRDKSLFAAPKPLVQPWLKQDWKAFTKCQQKEFEKLWNRARKDGWTVRSETSTEVVVTTERYQIGHQWCWAHCGMALLAHRQGAEVATDPFWFPSTALSDVSSPEPGKQINGPDQLQML